jgi:hypothetical protein
VLQVLLLSVILSSDDASSLLSTLATATAFVKKCEVPYGKRIARRTQQTILPYGTDRNNFICTERQGVFGLFWLSKEYSN